MLGPDEGGEEGQQLGGHGESGEAALEDEGADVVPDDDVRDAVRRIVGPDLWHEGAVELMDTSYRRTGEAEVEDRAWILTQIAHLSLLTGRADAAERLLNEALRLFPGYHYALAQMAEVRTQQGRLGDAVTLREKHVRVAPHPENRFAFGVALARAGRMTEARAAWNTFEAAALKESASWDSANVELVYYYADWADRHGEALALARVGGGRQHGAHAGGGEGLGGHTGHAIGTPCGGSAGGARAGYCARTRRTARSRTRHGSAGSSSPRAADSSSSAKQAR